MQVFDIMIVLCLLALPIFIFNMKKQQQKEAFILHIFIGIYFAFTYFAFRYWQASWYFFSFLHGYGLMATLMMPFALAYLVKGTNKAKMIALFMASMLVLSPITRPFLLAGPFCDLGDGRYRTTIMDFTYAIPLHICNISTLIYLVALLLPARHVATNTLKNYMITLGFLGGLINNIRVRSCDVQYFWHYFHWENYIVHALIIILPIYMVLTGQIKVKKRYVLYNLTWLVPAYLILGFVINPWMGFNYWFTSPVKAMSMLPGQTYSFTFFGSAVYPIYMLFILLLIAIACSLLFGLFQYMEKKFTPYFIAPHIMQDIGHYPLHLSLKK